MMTVILWTALRKYHLQQKKHIRHLRLRSNLKSTRELIHHYQCLPLRRRLIITTIHQTALSVTKHRCRNASNPNLGKEKNTGHSNVSIINSLTPQLTESTATLLFDLFHPNHTPIPLVIFQPVFQKGNLVTSSQVRTKGILFIQPKTTLIINTRVAVGYGESQQQFTWKLVSIMVSQTNRVKQEEGVSNINNIRKHHSFRPDQQSHLRYSSLDGQHVDDGYRKDTSFSSPPAPRTDSCSGRYFFRE